MALNLVIKEGRRVYVGDRFLTVVKTLSKFHMVLSTDDGREFNLTDESSVEVFPAVWISVGMKSAPGMASIAFEAPDHIMILREEKMQCHGWDGVSVQGGDDRGPIYPNA